MENNISAKWIYLILFFMIAVAIWVAWLLIVPKYFSSLCDSGQFGDMFGGVNALITALAFAGFLFSIYLQRKDLEAQKTSIDKQIEELKLNREELVLQREEIELNRKELAGQKDQLENQSLTLQQQRFENTFFQLLDKLQNVKDRILYKDPLAYSIKVGKINNSITQHYKNNLSNIDPECAKQFIDIGINNLGSDLLHYINILYSTLGYIYRYQQSPSIYSNVLRSQISEHELDFCFYYGLSSNATNFKLMSEELQLFHFLNCNRIIIKDMIKCYDKSAFGKIKSAN